MDLRFTRERNLIQVLLGNFDFTDYKIIENFSLQGGKKNFICKIRTTQNSNIYWGIGSDHCKYKAILKACAEVAEEWIRIKYGFENRNGMAAGLTKNMAHERALAEAIERDSFLFHWEGSIPFAGLNVNPSFSKKKLRAFSLRPTTVKRRTYHTTLLWDPDFEISDKKYLLFSSGCSSQINKSLQKSLQELSWGGDFLKVKIKRLNNVDSLNDPLELCFSSLGSQKTHQRWLNLCGSGPEVNSCTPRTPFSLPMEKLKSEFFKTPVKHFNVCRVTHPDLRELTWESGSKILADPHPFW